MDIFYINQALLNLKASKLRASLAVLGILIGTSSIVALLNCGKLATEQALAQFKAMGTNSLAVTFYPKVTEAERAMQHKISLDFWQTLPYKYPAMTQVAPYATVSQSLIFKGRNIQGTVLGATESLRIILHILVTSGRFISPLDSFEHFCVIGSSIAAQMQKFSFEELVGQQIQIGESIYTIVGVTAPWDETAFFNEDINRAVILPLAAMSAMNQSTKINQAIISLKPNSNITAIMELLRQDLQLQFPELNVFVRSAKQIIDGMEKQARIFTILLGVVGGISLIVGGIGIMNVMLMSVNERKKEIGIRKAVGATNRDIQNLFLTEAVLLSVAGGALGVVLGVCLTGIIAYFSAWNFQIYILPLLIGLGVSIAAGVCFGYYPARRAAWQHPVLSLQAVS